MRGSWGRSLTTARGGQGGGQGGESRERFEGYQLRILRRRQGRCRGGGPVRVGKRGGRRGRRVEAKMPANEKHVVELV